MSNKKIKANLTPDEEAFLEYVQNMPKSVGQRFAQIMIEEYGFEAFEDFWQQLRSARHEQEPYLELDEQERTALAKALYAHNRRDFLRSTAGFGLCLASALMGRSAAQDIAGSGRYTSREKDETWTMLKISGALLTGGAGLYLIGTDGQPSYMTIANIANGENGQRNVTKLVRTLDTLFDPIEMSMQETGVKTRY